ncbi:ABC transporter ATP-binding protein [Heyndrickxia oleronia]|uniref:ABC transporter ATP-binding protein n=1 Tax=Heyndrickxia oleronia TaxID=38875 RepID=A0AAW6SRB9_9BACI|nr:ABC transporter ATP-binding protein [Heyndrickxia oleronia]MCM3236487.1 ABC transporter ATP-binding protein [Heyndrickxia oleronia]MDH5159509.1 ABC transporter ATP-binding protein [Heyndrickxia oleronia]
MSIYVKNITKSFQNRNVLQDVSFQIEKGRCVALIGPNGAGKTTLLNILVGLLDSDHGEISYQKTKDWKKEIGFLPQIPSFYNWMTAKEFLLFMGKVSQIDTLQLKSKVADVLESTGLTDDRNRKIQGFSGGMKQRLGLAQALLHEPSLLFLDEPVSALDPVGRRDFMNILSSIKGKTTIVYSTHILHDAEEISDDVLFLKQGSIIAYGTLEKFISQTSKTYTLKISNDFPYDLSTCSFIKSVKMLDAKTANLTFQNEGSKEELLQWCLINHLDIIEFQKEKLTLESVFMEEVKR